MTLHPAIGRLRGRAAPADHLLDRLVAINPQWRVHWSPWFDGQWYWVIGNCVGSDMLREVGKHRLDRLTALQHEEATATSPASVAGAELMLDGQWIVKRYTEEQFGTDFMFNELATVRDRMEQLDAEQKAARDKERRKREWELVKHEATQNERTRRWLEHVEEEHPGWQEQQEAMLKESWSYYMQGAVSKTQLGTFKTEEVTV